MTTIYQTRCDKVNWDNLKLEVITKLEYLRIAWAASERGAHPVLHKQIVEDLYVPCIRLLAEFCACLKVTDDDSPSGENPVNGNEMRQ